MCVGGRNLWGVANRPHVFTIFRVGNCSFVSIRACQKLLNRGRLCFLCVWVFCLHVCVCSMLMPGEQGSQKRPFHPLKLELTVMTCHCGSENSDPLQDQQTLLTTKLSLQHRCEHFKQGYPKVSNTNGPWTTVEKYQPSEYEDGTLMFVPGLKQKFQTGLPLLAGMAFWCYARKIMSARLIQTVNQTNKKIKHIIVTEGPSDTIYYMINLSWYYTLNMLSNDT